MRSWWRHEQQSIRMVLATGNGFVLFLSNWPGCDRNSFEQCFVQCSVAFPYSFLISLGAIGGPSQAMMSDF